MIIDRNLCDCDGVRGQPNYWDMSAVTGAGWIVGWLSRRVNKKKISAHLLRRSPRWILPPHELERLSEYTIGCRYPHFKTRRVRYPAPSQTVYRLIAFRLAMESAAA